MYTFKNTARIERDKKFRSVLQKYELHKKILKAVALDQTLPYDARFSASMRLQGFKDLCPNATPHNRCVVTGRGRGVFRKQRMSRITIRQFAKQGQLLNTYKATW